MAAGTRRPPTWGGGGGYSSGYVGDPVCFPEPRVAGVVAEVDVRYVRRTPGSAGAGVTSSTPINARDGRAEWRAGMDPEDLVPPGDPKRRYVGPADAVRAVVCSGWTGLHGRREGAAGCVHVRLPVPRHSRPGPRAETGSEKGRVHPRDGPRGDAATDLLRSHSSNGNPRCPSDADASVIRAARAPSTRLPAGIPGVSRAPRARRRTG